MQDVHRARRRATAATGALVVALLAACTWGTDQTPTSTPAVTATPAPSPVSAAPGTPPPASVVVGGDAQAALATSAALLTSAPVAVVAPGGDTAAVLTASTAAVATGAPMLLTGDGVEVADELGRLGTQHVLLVGDVAQEAVPADVVAVRTPAGADADTLAAVVGHDLGDVVAVAPGGEAAAVRALARPRPAVLVAAPAPADDAAVGDAPADGAAAPTSDAPGRTATDATAAAGRGPSGPASLPPTSPVAAEGVVVFVDSTLPLAAVATARALDVEVLDVPGGDPRATSGTVQAVAAAAPTAVLAFGESFGTPERLAARTATARTGVELPGGGQLVFPTAPGLPGTKYVALYGTPGSSALGVLGEQDVPATVARAEQHAAPYRALTGDTVVPAVEIIATIASAGPEPDGSYSRKRAVADLRPLVDAAGAAGQYVVLDLQPGRQDFVTQAQAYAELLALPHVGLALDPEWRLAPDQVHLRQIGTVGIDEVNATAAWLAQLTRDNALPQKMFVLHQFSLRMIGERERLDTSHDELAPLIHVDGQGSQPAKAGTWATLRNGAPPVHWGWKNFYDEDVPMLDPVQTYQVQPVPDLVTYQ
ncbi:putative lipoprotein [Cellulomonas flavigena DSM 20109]|uniref:Putative lipoprotein n=1 Tax=Cellulomonas flavigena (strain ATCC 482 / DSM 20109 / BCRC 11376 / JCM 18109 / NBRC 3775 / NCIMB 8073 / NRS 134) TaxID=446466 RepID=D5UGN3_CELFN|nr:hypothetical protein [Cellulomonas flavigena]ADG75131.1 putative lipoprotein [Cellulomonas flavigena DSM 20109]